MARALNWGLDARRQTAADVRRSERDRSLHAASAPAELHARYRSTCRDCGGRIQPGDLIRFSKVRRFTIHADCRFPGERRPEA